MGLLDFLFSGSSSSSNGEAPDYIKKTYSDNGLNCDHEFDGMKVANAGRKMYCTRCRTVSNGGYKCRECGNLLVEWR